jgi:hypothetical protein
MADSEIEELAEERRMERGVVCHALVCARPSGVSGHPRCMIPVRSKR